MESGGGMGHCILSWVSQASFTASLEYFMVRHASFGIHTYMHFVCACVRVCAANAYGLRLLTRKLQHGRLRPPQCALTHGNVDTSTHTPTSMAPIHGSTTPCLQRIDTRVVVLLHTRPSVQTVPHERAQPAAAQDNSCSLLFVSGQTSAHSAGVEAHMLTRPRCGTQEHGCARFQ